MALTKLVYTNNSNISASNLNDIQDAIVNLDANKAHLSNPVFTGNVKLSEKKGYYLVDQTGSQYPGLIDNGSDLWIGAAGSGTSYASHVGNTYLSTGYDETKGEGYSTFIVGVPNENNTNFQDYYAFHDGYINYNMLYPVGSSVVTSTNVSPGTKFPGTTWELIDKKFTPCTKTADDGIFTINSTNTTALSSCYAIYGENTIYIRIAVTNKVAYSDSAKVVGTLNFNKLGISQVGLTHYSVDSYTNDGQAITIFTISNTAGTLTVTDFIGPSPSTATGKVYYYNAVYPVPKEYMLDSACNQFIWKRTA